MTSMIRGTGGNRFVGPDATILEFIHCVKDQLAELKIYAEHNNLVFDLGAVTVDTMRSNSNQISVGVSADLKSKE